MLNIYRMNAFLMTLVVYHILLLCSLLTWSLVDLRELIIGTAQQTRPVSISTWRLVDLRELFSSADQTRPVSVSTWRLVNINLELG